jgi:putative NADH-flavin reductase
MRVALLGGTGRIGGHLLGSMLAAGHDVTALARDPAVLTGPPDGTAAGAGSLTVISGGATDPAAVQAAVDGADAVLSALGPRGAKTPALLGTAARNITAAMDKTGTRRLICVSAAGAFVAGDPDLGRLVKLILPRVFAAQFADVRDMEAAVSEADLDWTLVRATRLVNTPLTGRYRVRPEYAPAGGGKISRPDVAHFIAATLAGEGWIGGRPALAY